MNIVTKKPQFAPEGSVELAAGGHNMYRVAADFTAPITDSIAARINGAYEDADSFRDYITWKKYVVTPSVLFRIGDATTLSYELELVHQGRRSTASMMLRRWQAGRRQHPRVLGEPDDGVTEIKATGHQVVLQHDFNADWSMLVGLGYRQSSFEGFSSDPELAASRQPFYADATESFAPAPLPRLRRDRFHRAGRAVGSAVDGPIDAPPAVRHRLLRLRTRLPAEPFPADTREPICRSTCTTRCTDRPRRHCRSSTSASSRTRRAFTCRTRST